VTEEKWIINSPRFPPTLWYGYVDGTFSMFDSKDTATEFLKYLNSRHNSIKFTIEFEQAKEILFLDILVKRCPNNTFTTSVNRFYSFVNVKVIFKTYGTSNLSSHTMGPSQPITIIRSHL